MSQRYEKSFSALKSQKSGAFIPFTVLGWPDKKTCLDVVKSFIENGAAGLELGLAFSDPVADGPVIQAAVHETLSSGFKVDDAFALLKEIRKFNQEIPIGILMYYNMLLKRGVERFFADLAACGADSVLIADLPADCADEVSGAAKKNGIDLVFIVSPMTTPERMDIIAAHAGAYIYIVSRLGTTGVEDRFDGGLKSTLALARSKTNLPLMVGFGVSTPEQARQMCQLGADGVITGSRIIQLVKENCGHLIEPALSTYLRSMTESVC